MGVILADIINWGWLSIGQYIHLNIDPVIFRIGPLAVRWYGLMYVVAILMGLWAIKGYCERKGITQDLVYSVLWWCIGAGLLGGRLYFVIQQPDLLQHYILQPQHILATWEGGMAFFGAIFLIIPTLIWRARVKHLNPLVLIDAGVLFGAAGQIFGRIGNIINGDIIGYPSTLPWSTVYDHPDSWACLNPATCHVPVQPAAAYELLTNIVVLSLMFFLARRVRKPGVLMLVYLFSYAITQFFIFFTRANDIVSFLGLNWGLKQAQWTSLVVLIALLPITYLVLRYSRPVPDGEVAVTYGIPQPPPAAVKEGPELKEGDVEDDDEPDKSAEPADKPAESEVDAQSHSEETIPEEKDALVNVPTVKDEGTGSAQGA
ncbi:MAG TPA: prolipoprotein diacylglyceryl transferase [Ktedonosporobacter sp.]|nr:prolipoprotein diacylglyceryl transferase [Ktedonosporobacter sp.]